jgi:hypothetical protein
MTEKNLKHNNNLIKEQTQKYHIPVDVKAGGYGECLSCNNVNLQFSQEWQDTCLVSHPIANRRAREHERRSDPW